MREAAMGVIRPVSVNNGQQQFLAGMVYRVPYQLLLDIREQAPGHTVNLTPKLSVLAIAHVLQVMRT